MRYFVVLLFCFILTGSCSTPEDETQIPDEELVVLLVDLHIAEAATSHLPTDIKDSVTNIYYEQIYRKHEVDSLMFKAQMDKLKKEPGDLKKIYEKVVSELEKVQNKPNDPPKKGQVDSA